MRPLLFVLFFILGSSVIYAQDQKPMKFKKKAPEYIFLLKVRDAVIAHDADALLHMMKPDYKRSQHDEFLEGRTLQFLTEFFCSDIPFNEITDAQLIFYKENQDMNTETSKGYDVRMLIKNAGKFCYADFFMTQHLETKVLSLYGAVG